MVGRPRRAVVGADLAGTGVLRRRQRTGVALLGGIGFTMSLFVTELAFDTGAVADEARVGILLASIAAGIAGYLMLRKTLPAANPD